MERGRDGRAQQPLEGSLCPELGSWATRKAKEKKGNSMASASFLFMTRESLAKLVPQKKVGRIGMSRCRV